MPCFYHTESDGYTTESICTVFPPGLLGEPETVTKESVSTVVDKYTLITGKHIDGSSESWATPGDLTGFAVAASGSSDSTVSIRRVIDMAWRGAAPWRDMPRAYVVAKPSGETWVKGSLIYRYETAGVSAYTNNLTTARSKAIAEIVGRSFASYASAVTEATVYRVANDRLTGDGDGMLTITSATPQLQAGMATNVSRSAYSATIGPSTPILAGIVTATDTTVSPGRYVVSNTSAARIPRNQTIVGIGTGAHRLACTGLHDIGRWPTSLDFTSGIIDGVITVRAPFFLVDDGATLGDAWSVDFLADDPYGLFRVVWLPTAGFMSPVIVRSVNGNTAPVTGMTRSNMFFSPQTGLKLTMTGAASTAALTIDDGRDWPYPLTLSDRTVPELIDHARPAIADTDQWSPAGAVGTVPHNGRMRYQLERKRHGGLYAPGESLGPDSEFLGYGYDPDGPIWDPSAGPPNYLWKYMTQDSGTVPQWAWCRFSGGVWTAISTWTDVDADTAFGGFGDSLATVDAPPLPSGIDDDDMTSIQLFFRWKWTYSQNDDLGWTGRTFSHDHWFMALADVALVDTATNGVAARTAGVFPLNVIALPEMPAPESDAAWQGCPGWISSDAMPAVSVAWRSCTFSWLPTNSTVAVATSGAGWDAGVGWSTRHASGYIASLTNNDAQMHVDWQHGVIGARGGSPTAYALHTFQAHTEPATYVALGSFYQDSTSFSWGMRCYDIDGSDASVTMTRRILLWSEHGQTYAMTSTAGTVSPP